MTRAYQAVIAVLVLSSCLTSEGGDLDAGVDITKEGSPSTTAPRRAHWQTEMPSLAPEKRA